MSAIPCTVLSLCSLAAPSAILARDRARGSHGGVAPHTAAMALEVDFRDVAGESLPDVSRLSVGQLFEVRRHARQRIMQQAGVAALRQPGQQAGDSQTAPRAQLPSVTAGAPAGRAADEDIRRYAAERVPQLTALCVQALNVLVEMPAAGFAVERAEQTCCEEDPLEFLWPSGRLLCLDRLCALGLADPSLGKVGVALDLLESFAVSVFVYGIVGCADMIAAVQRLVGYLRELFAVLALSCMDRPRDRARYQQMVSSQCLFATTMCSELHRAYLNVIGGLDARLGTSAEAGGKRRRV